MSDIVITAANVKPSGTTQITYNLLAGAAITAGQALYKDTTTTPATMKLCQADGAGIINVFAGIALNNAAIGQPVAFATSDPGGLVTGGAGLSIGDTLITSGTAGAIAPAADGDAGDFITNLGIINGAGNLVLNPTAAGTAK